MSTHTRTISYLFIIYYSIFNSLISMIYLGESLCLFLSDFVCVYVCSDQYIFKLM